jgi:hypothetical protein
MAVLEDRKTPDLVAVTAAAIAVAGAMWIESAAYQRLASERWDDGFRRWCGPLPRTRSPP